MSTILYRDASVIISESGIVIPNYYFPFKRPKRVPWSMLRSAQLRKLSLLDGRLKLWGMGLRPYWFNLDHQRLKKTHYIYLDTGAPFKPCFTPDNPEVAFSIIDQKLQSNAAKTPMR